MSSTGIACSAGGCDGSVGATSGSGSLGVGVAGVTEAGRGAGTPRCGVACGVGPNELSAQSTPAPTMSSGMISAHQALLAGGDFEGMRLRRQSSHSPCRSSGSSCFSQIPIESTICASVYHGPTAGFMEFQADPIEPRRIAQPRRCLRCCPRRIRGRARALRLRRQPLRRSPKARCLRSLV